MAHAFVEVSPSSLLVFLILDLMRATAREAIAGGRQDAARVEDVVERQQRRPDVLEQRRDWFAFQLDLDPAKLVFVDETGASTSLARKHGRWPRPEPDAALPRRARSFATIYYGL